MVFFVGNMIMVIIVMMSPLIKTLRASTGVRLMMMSLLRIVTAPVVDSFEDF